MKKKNEWSLDDIFNDLHKKVQSELEISRTTGHPSTKGATSEKAWLTLLQKHLPTRYEATSGFVFDIYGNRSQQIDIIVYDRFYSPLIFDYGNEKIVPAESVYAVIEVKQYLNNNEIDYAVDKVCSVRELHRTNSSEQSTSNYSIEQEEDETQLFQIIGGIVAFDCSPKHDVSEFEALVRNRKKNKLRKDNELLDIGCISSYGYLIKDDKYTTPYLFTSTQRAVTDFLFLFISLLQNLGSVPMIDYKDYIKLRDYTEHEIQVVKTVNKKRYSTEEDAKMWIENKSDHKDIKNYEVLEENQNNFAVVKKKNKKK